MPSDIPTPAVGEEARLAGASFGAERFIINTKAKGAKSIFAVLDACRDNPFPDKGTKSTVTPVGLDPMENTEGVFVLFAAGVRQQALDRLSDGDENPNSVFTRSLLPALKTPGLSQVDIAKRVRAEVKKAAATLSHEQTPAYYDELDGYVTLLEGPVADAPPAQNDSYVKSMERMIASTDKMWSEVFKDLGIKYVSPRVIKVTDATKTKCGSVFESGFAVYCNTDQTLLVPFLMFSDLELIETERNTFYPNLIAAKLVGQHLQHVFGLTERVQKQSGKLSEQERDALYLQIDLITHCLAGMAINAAVKDGTIKKASPDLLFKTIQLDERLHQDSDSNPQFILPIPPVRGLPEQRISWLERGMKAKGLAECDTLAAGSL